MKKHKKTPLNPLHFLSQKRSVLYLLALTLISSFFFSIFELNNAPPCVNADEAAFGYNAYSLLKTGADEYGNVLPVRLKSFGDYKMPLYSYLSVPFIAMVGLNETGVRMLNIVLAIIFPFVVYFLVKELFEKDEVAAISAFLISTSLGLGIVHRHAHEAYLAAFLITLSSFFFIRFLKYERLKDGTIFILFIFLALFAYQSSRLYALFFFLFALGYFIYKYKKKFLKSRVLFFSLFIVAIGLFAITDIIYKPERVQNLLLFNDKGFAMRTYEFVGEGGSKFIYNKATMGVKQVVAQEMQFFSPQFLAIDGDKNHRFGYPGMSPMTILEYLFIFIGLYFIFKNKERWRFFLLFLLIVTPLTAALSWNEGSLTRSLFLHIPLLGISAYGFYSVLVSAAGKRVFVPVLLTLVLVQSVALFYSWDMYFNHYPKRETVALSWQCGYKEMASHVKAKYESKDIFYITKKHGEPYIFLLFYLNYPPEKYQKTAHLSAPDIYGFGQVEKFDKFNFSVPGYAFRTQNALIIGYPDDIDPIENLDRSKIKHKIFKGRDDIFWIYET